jgi:hypothetical protein
MKKITISVLFVLVFSLFSISIDAQKNKKPVKPKPSAKAKNIVFAILNYNDGKKMLEPIALVEAGKLVDKEGENSATKEPSDFFAAYYKPDASYDVIFGGNVAGKAVVSKDAKTAQCSPNMADADVQFSKGTLKGFVMALATNLTPKKSSGLRRLPTTAERTEIEKLVRAEFTKGKVSASALKTMTYHNLTATDANNDGKIELIGSYYTKTSASSRSLFFFIAEKNAAGKFVFSHKELETIKKDEVMSGEITSLDDGTYHELLIDMLDINGDGVSEIFTITQAFEGNNFAVYSKTDGKWTRSFEAGNYHCGY